MLYLKRVVLVLALACVSSAWAEGLFAELWQEPAGKRMRVSSWNPSGENEDNRKIAAGETLVVADVQGSGKVTRLWMTNDNAEPDWLSKLKVSFTFDGVKTIDRVPMGMLFATGPWKMNDVVTPAVSVMRSVRSGEKLKGTGYGSLNFHLAMPYAKGFKMEITNDSNKRYAQFFYVDYEEFEHTKPPLLLHADYRSEFPTKRVAAKANRNPKDNYLLADIEGYEGNYVGTVLCVESHPDRKGKWYEGDEMFVVDGESWPPRLHGTGTEDYFGMAWGVHRPYQALDHGVTHFEKPITDHDRYYDGRFVLYRWHLADPIAFHKSLHASIEAGHGNDCEQNYQSVAWWYGRRAESK